jgi:site-specific recombinase XerD
MATINFMYRSTKPNAPLTIRFYVSGKDLKHATQIYVPKKNWDVKRQRVKTSADLPEATSLNENIIKLEAHLMTQYSLSYMNGEEIDNDWLRNSVLHFFNRPKYELEKQKRDERTTELVTFSDYFVTEVIGQGKWKDAKTKKPISDKTADGYITTLNLLKRFDEERKRKTKFKDVSIEWCEEFTSWMQQQNYRTNYISKNIGRIKFFILRAEEEKIEINSDFRNRAFSAPTEQTVSTYLNEQELTQIYNHSFELNSKYDNVRDWLIIGSYTGLRVSDFLKRLTTKHIENDIIHLKTKKTGENVAIPVHHYIKSILEKRNGTFPKQYSDQKFNVYIKDVCKLAGIDNEILVDVYDPETKRKAQGVSPKYLAVSSHICRRSFATNHFGKIPSDIIMKIGGWRTESSFLKYLRKTSTESAMELKKYWDNQNTIEIKN